ncbi:MAG TPA: BatA and WFA domain-containing protein [Vicinamibacterales bacterium]|nr:BatA and WFA domain-containing protein [Vicinamibacterales bacterium]
MSFLSPLFLIGALAAAIPILLHLFHRKTEVVIDFPAVSLLKRAPVQQHRRRRLRELFLLALRVVALILLALSFARPYFAGATAPESAPLTVIAIDTSMSMSAPGQFDRARDAAIRALNAAPSSHAVALIGFADAATVLVPPTTDRPAITATLAGLAPGGDGTRFRTALARASEVVGARDARVVVVTDLQQIGWESNDDGGLPDGVGVEVISVAPPSGNLAVTFAERRGRGIAASIQNYGNSDVRAPVRLLVAGKEVARAEAALAPLGAADVELAAALPAAGAAEVRVDDTVGYQLDNVRIVALDPTAAIPITVVVADPVGTTGGLYLERALRVAGDGREFDVTVRDGREVASWSADDWSKTGAVFVLGTRTLDRAGRQRLRTYLEQGGQMMLTLGPDVDPGTISDVIGINLTLDADPVRSPGATLIASDGRHPIFRPFLNPSGALGDVQVEQHRRLNSQATGTVLARFSGGDAALIEHAAGKGRLMIFTSDLDNQWSRFPLNPAFVPFAIETARYLTSARRAPATSSAADGRESNPAATTVEEFTKAIERTARGGVQAEQQAAREVEDRQRWWQIGLVIMLVALAGEALLGRRTT